MHDWRHDPNATHVTHSDRLGTYEELQVRSGPRVQNDPTWFAASDTATATKVPAPYGIPTSTDRIDALTKQVDTLREQQAAIMRQLHDISEQMAAMRADVPFGTLRMAEDAWGVG